MTVRPLPEVLADVPPFSGLPPRALEEVAAAMHPAEVPAGGWLFRQGDAGDAYFVVVSGRLDIIRDGVAVGVVGPGEAVGEAALLEGRLRTAGLRARRDARLMALDRADFDRLVARPEVARSLLQVLSRRLRAGPGPAGASLAGGPLTIAVVATARPGGTRRFLATLAAGLRAGGRVVVLDGPTIAGAAGEEPSRRTAAISALLDRVERDADVVVLDAGEACGSLAASCASQADRTLLVCDRAGPPPLEGGWWARAEIVVLDDRPLRVPHRGRPLHRVRPVHLVADTARLARRLTGRAVGLVLGGGGARGLSHIGVLQALEESGVVVDRLGGTSIGAMVSALAAAGHPPTDLARTCRRELAERRPFGDYTLPRHGLIRARRAVTMLQRVLGDAEVADLPLPWFALSAELMTAREVVHRDGPVWHAVACSMSLPGLAPPRLHDGVPVIDGGVLNNLPIDVMAADGEGPVLAVEVGRRFTHLGGSEALPSLAEVLAGTMGLSSRQEVARRHAQAVAVIEPALSCGLLDFDQMDAAVAAGRAAALATLEGLDDAGRTLLGC